MRPENNLEFYRLLRDLPPDKQQAEYVRLASKVEFKVKSLGWLMKKGAEYEALNGEQ